MERHNTFLGFLTILALGISSLGFSNPPFQTKKLETPEAIQVVLVIDVSGSMGSGVITGGLPDDLATIRDRIVAIETNPDYIRLREEYQAILSAPGIQTAQAKYYHAIAAVDQWLEENGYGKSRNAVGDKIVEALGEMGCQDEYGYSIAGSETRDEADHYLVYACAGITLSDQSKQRINSFVPYVDNLNYRALTHTERSADSEYNALLNSKGANAVHDQIGNFLDAQNYNSLYDQLNFLVGSKKITLPTRLSLAQAATNTLIDLSRLDRNATGISSQIGLVVFSDYAELPQPHTENFDTLKSKVNGLTPLYATNVGLGLNLALEEISSADPASKKLIILLSDGQINRGLTSRELMSQIPPQASGLGVTICSIGFGNSEQDVDVALLQGLANATGGQYVFTSSGEQLLSFFVACRQKLFGKVIPYTGIVKPGETVQAAQIEVPQQTGEMSLALTFLTGNLQMSVVDPSGKVVSEDYGGAVIQQAENLQLITIKNPNPGLWKTSVTNNASAGQPAMFSITTTTKRGAETGTGSGASKPLRPVILCMIVLATVLIVVFVFLRRKWVESKRRQQEQDNGYLY